MIKIFNTLSRIVFCVVSLALATIAVGLIVYAAIQFVAVFGSLDGSIGQTLLDSVGYAVIATAVFEVAKYIFEEEVMHPSEMRHAGEARRSMTKFVSTIAIAIFLEALVTIFQTGKDPTATAQMLYPTLLLLAGVALIVGLGIYQRLSTAAELEVHESPKAEADERADLEKREE